MPQESAAMTHESRFGGSRTSAPSLLVLCAVLLASCSADGNGGGGAAGAEVVDQWQAAPEPGRRYGTVFVIGVAQTDEVRRLFEDAFVRELEAQGVRGIASHATLPGTDVSRGQVVAAVRASGADGVVVTRLLKREQRHKASLSPGDYYAHYSNASKTIYAPQPSVVYRSEVVTLETRLFDAAREQMVWAASTELFDPRATQAQVGRLVRSIVKDLKEGSLI
jgi:hypothetical protein